MVINPTHKYEYVFTNKYQEVFVRMFDPANKSSYIVKYNTNDVVPDLYIPHKYGEYYSHIDNNIKLKKLSFTTHKSFKETLKQLESSGVIVHGNTSKPQNFIREHFQPTANHNHDMHIWVLDIEVRKEGTRGYAPTTDPFQKVSLIQVYSTLLRKYIILGTKDWSAEYQQEFKSEFGPLQYVKFDSETLMLEGFIKLLNKLNPTIITGYNSNFYDVPYLTNRIERLGLDKDRLSPIGVVEPTNRHNIAMGTYYEGWSWKGIMLLDYQDLYFKYTFNKLPDAKLETVCQFELGKGKIDYSKFATMEDLYIGNYKKFYPSKRDSKDLDILDRLYYSIIDSAEGSSEQLGYIKQFQDESYNIFVSYGIVDLERLLELDEKVKYLDTAQLIGYKTGVNAEDVSGTLEQWSAWVYSRLLEHNEVLPVKQHYADPRAVYAGGWTTSKPGKHHYVGSVDFSSLYPNNVRSGNIGLETYVKPENIHPELMELLDTFYTFYVPTEEMAEIRKDNNNFQEVKFFKSLVDNKEQIHAALEKHNVTCTPNGKFYTKEKNSMFSDLIREIYADRKIEQKLLSKYQDALERLKISK